MFNNKLKTEQQIMKTTKAKCERAVSLRHGLGTTFYKPSNFIIFLLKAPNFFMPFRISSGKSFIDCIVMFFSSRIFPSELISFLYLARLSVFFSLIVQREWITVDLRPLNFFNSSRNKFNSFSVFLSNNFLEERR